MNLIDRYVHAVAEYLPDDIGNDVLVELRTNIEDMLPENYTEEDVYKVLKELGSPLKLANEYSPKIRYLIGPKYYDKYLTILKMVVGILVAVSIGIAVIVTMVNPSKTDINEIIVELITNIISGGLAGIVQGAFWVTLIFVILERSGVESEYLPFGSKEWTPDMLPEIPVDDHVNISRRATIFSMVCIIIFTALLYLHPQLIAIYIKGENDIINYVPFFNVNRLNIYMIFIFALAVYQLGIFVWKFITGRWNRPLVILSVVYNVLICLLFIFMLSDSTLFNTEFVPAIAELTKGSVNIIGTWLEKAKWVFAGIFIAFSAWDSISITYKYGAKLKK